MAKIIDAIKSDPSNPDNNSDWIDWASKKADWIDPTVATVRPTGKANRLLWNLKDYNGPEPQDLVFLLQTSQ